MSYIFEVGDTTVWSPALQVGDLYVRMAKSLGDWARTDTGLSAMARDYYRIEVDRFAHFVRDMLTGPASQHTLFQDMTEGFIAISLAMLDRAGAPMADPEALALAGHVATAAASMPD